MKAGFIGLGVQGKYLAINEAKAGFDLAVYDVRSEPLTELAASGARVARSCRDAARDAEVVQVCVLDDAQLEDAVLGEDGVLAGAGKGAILVVHSTVRPSTIAKLAASAERRGVEVADVPVSGSERGAREKTMSFMVGGSDAAFAKCRPLFEASGSKFVRTGPLGTGIRAKIAHQLVVCVNMLSAYEGLAMADKAGLDRDVLLKVVGDGAAQSRMADGILKGLIASSSNRVFRKDLRLCLEYAKELGIPAPGAALALEYLDSIVPPPEARR
jgi:3-hydroxyisobutyrate dehydrogenase-like beta-hydroxyacid dehydrogenase